MNKHVADELGKVRELNLTGETEKLFESWRNEWDNINGRVFTHLEEELMDAEEFEEKYRSRKYFHILNETEKTLNEDEKTDNNIIDEFERILSSEKDISKAVSRHRP